MKQLNTFIKSVPLIRKLNAYLAATATVALVAIALAGLHGRANASPSQGDDEDNLYNKAQVAEVTQLLTDFHGALYDGGDLTAMSSLWAEDSSLTLNGGTPYVGKAAVLSFLVNGPYFTHHWASLAPEWKTQITVHGDTADFSTQCVGVDLTVQPMVVRSVIQIHGTAIKRDGKWLLMSMNNTTPAPI